MALKFFRAAPLPNPPSLWDPQYMRQLIRVIETYFGQLDSKTPNYAESYTADDFYGSGLHITTPYGQFSSSSDQSAASTATAYPISFSSSDFIDGITLSSSSHLTVPHAGVYSVTFSLQAQNTTNDIEYLDVWLRKNGTNIASTNSQFSLPQRKSTGAASSLIAETTILIQLAANDYIEVMWHVTNTGVGLKYLPAVAASGSTPAIPATPSAIVQVHYVSGV